VLLDELLMFREFLHEQKSLILKQVEIVVYEKAGEGTK
jgi:hypothetical protein